jgi:hypothetical protein
MGMRVGEDSIDFAFEKLLGRGSEAHGIAERHL